MTSQTGLRTSRMINRVPFFYGWVVLVAGLIATVMIGPSQTFTVSLYIDTYVSDFGISRANIALLYGVATLSASLLLPITGRLTDRFGARRMIVVATAGLVLSCALMARVNGLVTLVLFFLLLRFFGFGSMQLISNHAIAQWFIVRRGFVMGLAGLSLAGSLLLFPALAESLISSFGWRQSWVGLGLILGLVMFPVGWLFIRDTPELYGKRPDGDNLIAGNTGTATEDNWTLPEARRTAIFWIFAVGLACLTMIMAGLVFHQLSLFEARGLSRAVAVRNFQYVALFTVLGNLSSGPLLDRISPRKILATLMVLLAVQVLWLQLMTQPWHAILYALLFGMVGGSYRVVDSTVWANYFGRKHLGSIRGATMIGTLGGTAFGAYPLGLSYDYFGSYNPALNAFVVLPIVLAGVALVAARPAKGKIED